MSTGRAARNRDTQELRMFPQRRGDLRVSSQWVRGRRVWHVKDPVSLRYFSFTEEEYGILRLLDGRRSLARVLEDFHERFAPRQLTEEQLRQFLARLLHCELLRGPASRSDAQSWRIHPMQLLAIRLPGIDIDPLLNRLYRLLGWVFSWYLFAAAVLLVGSALVVSFAKADDIARRLPELGAFLRLENVVWLAVALCCSRLLHELGHALTCKHYGGECHDAGILFLVFTPCLYCDVSDSWMAANRWQRIAISSAGIFVDVVVASLALIAWTYSKPGVTSSVLLNLVMVCGLSTIFINGNPLLRYDGYYVLSDLLDLPNLWDRSRRATRDFVAKWCLGASGSPQMDSSGSAIVLILYGLASSGYRVFVLTAIVLLAYRSLSPHGLRLVADALLGSIAVTAGLATVKSTSAAVRRKVSPTQDTQPRPARNAVAYRWPYVIASLAVLGGLVYSACIVPLDASFYVPGVVQFADSRPVYVAHAGRLVHTKAVGEAVTEGQVIARLDAPALDQELTQLQGLINRQQRRIIAIEALQFDAPDAAMQLPAARELLRDLEQQRAEKQKQQQRLRLIAPRDGVLLGAPLLERPTTPEELPHWHGRPTDQRNLGCYLERGTPFCSIGNPTQMEVVLVVDDEQIGRVRPGSKVHVLPHDGRAEILHGTVQQIAATTLHVAPTELSNTGDIATQEDALGRARPIQASFQVRVRLTPPSSAVSPAMHGLRCRARVEALAEPFVMQVLRWFRRNFV